MPGERTADSSGDSAGGWSTDDLISLREHMQRQIDAERRSSTQQIAAERAYFERVIVELRVQLDERFATQTKMLETAFTAADKAVTAALLAAEKAVMKAELASDKRFESVNEFRAQLADQAATFMPRTEAEIRVAALAERVDANILKLNELELRVSSRLDVTKGAAAGIEKAWGYIIGAVGLAGAVIAIIVSTR